ncbi:MAG: glycosyltransferase family 2 protein [Candidatus Gastranaerophilales bacterium]
MEFILNIFYIYITLYAIYFLALSIKNLNDNAFKQEKRHAKFEEKENLALIVYAKDNKNTLQALIDEIKLQDYPINNFKVFVVLDNCQDNSEALFAQESQLFKVLNIRNVGTVGKDQAVSILLEKLVNEQSIDSYVFIDANRSIPMDFLSTVNVALVKNDVICGETLIATDELGLVGKIKAAYQKYHMNFIRQARSLFGLAAQADSGVFIIRKNIVDEIGSVDFKNINTELKYSLLLSKIKFPCTYNPNIQTLVEAKDYEFKKPRLSVRMNLFRNCFTKIWNGNHVFAEHTISLLYPNIWLILFVYACALKHSYRYAFVVDFKIVLFSCLIMLVGFGISIVNSRLNLKEIGLLLLYPIYSFCHIINNLPPIRKIRNKIQNREELPDDTEKLSIQTFVMANGRQLPCKLEFISENGLSLVKFIYKNKKFKTDKHLRMIDALQELKIKLNDFGFILKICNCCTHFKSNIDGSTNMLNGFCNSSYPSPSIKEPKPTLIWNCCNEFIPAVINDMINDMIKENSNNE